MQVTHVRCTNTPPLHHERRRFNCALITSQMDSVSMIFRSFPEFYRIRSGFECSVNLTHKPINNKRTTTSQYWFLTLSSVEIFYDIKTATKEQFVHAASPTRRLILIPTHGMNVVYISKFEYILNKVRFADYFVSLPFTQ